MILLPLLTQIAGVDIPGLLHRSFALYGVGNVLNLAIAAGISLQGWDLRRLKIVEVDFQGLNLQNLDARNATFDRCRFSPSMGAILCLVFSPDGRYFAASDTNYKIKIWETATHREVALLLGHHNWVWHITFSSDGKYLLSGGTDCSMRVWDTATGECLQVLADHQDWVLRVAFGFTSNFVISICMDRYIKIWWWRTRSNLLTFRVPDLQTRDGAFDGRRGLLAVCSVDGLKIWQVWLGRCCLDLPLRNLRKVYFSPDGQLVICTSFDCNIYCWAVDGGHLRWVLSGHLTQILHVEYDGNDRMISSCAQQVRVWSLIKGTCLQAIDLTCDAGRGVVYRSPTLITGSDRGTIKSWNLETGKCLKSLGGNISAWMCLASNSQNKSVVAGTSDGMFQFFDLSVPITGELTPNRIYPAHNGLITALTYSPNAQLIASMGGDQTIKIWDVEGLALLHSLRIHTDTVEKLQFIDDRTILSSGYDGVICEWDFVKGQHKISIDSQQHWYVTAASSPDGKYIAIGSLDTILTVIDRQTNTRTTYPTFGSRLQKLGYSANGHFLVGITDDCWLNCWDLDRDFAHRYWSIGKNFITAFTNHPFYPDRLIVATDDAGISIWDLVNQSCLFQVSLFSSPQQFQRYKTIRSLAIVPNPNRLISCNLSGCIKIWDFVDDGLVEVHSSDFSRPYEGMKIAGSKGLNQPQKLTIQELGGQM